MDELGDFTLAHKLGLRTMYEKPKQEEKVATWDFMQLKKAGDSDKPESRASKSDVLSFEQILEDEKKSKKRVR